MYENYVHWGSLTAGLFGGFIAGWWHSDKHNERHKVHIQQLNER